MRSDAAVASATAGDREGIIGFVALIRHSACPLIH